MCRAYVLLLRGPVRLACPGEGISRVLRAMTQPCVASPGPVDEVACFSAIVVQSFGAPRRPFVSTSKSTMKQDEERERLPHCRSQSIAPPSEKRSKQGAMGR
jgi:hypothetical protein